MTMKDTLLCEEAGNDAAAAQHHHSPAQPILSHKPGGLERRLKTEVIAKRKKECPATIFVQLLSALSMGTGVPWPNFEHEHLLLSQNNDPA